MNIPDRLESSRVAILGLGLMGGSLALALQGRCEALLGMDPDPDTLALAQERRVVDRASSDAGSILADADIVVLAAPVRAILELIERLPYLHPGAAVVLDLGSTKTDICQAFEALPPRFDPVGGHPMCGKEVASLINADACLYQAAPFAFARLERTTGRAVAIAEEIARAVGAVPVWVDPVTHDRWVAATSHLPYLLANALAAATPGEAAPLAGPGFYSTTRLAITPADLMLDILATNQANILDALARFREQLETYEASLSQGDWETLKEILEEGASQRRKIAPEKRQGDCP